MAWSIYLLASAALLLVVWRVTRPVWGWLRDALRVVLAVVVLTPASVDGTQEQLAPALFIVTYEFLTAPDAGLGPLVGVRVALIAGFAVLGAWVLRFLWNRLVGGRRGSGVQPPAGR